MFYALLITAVTNKDPIKALTGYNSGRRYCWWTDTYAKVLKLDSLRIWSQSVSLSMHLILLSHPMDMLPKTMFKQVWRQLQTPPRIQHHKFLSPMHHTKCCIITRPTKRMSALGCCRLVAKPKLLGIAITTFSAAYCEEPHDCSTCETSLRCLYTRRVSIA